MGSPNLSFEDHERICSMGCYMYDKNGTRPTTKFQRLDYRIIKLCIFHAYRSHKYEKKNAHQNGIRPTTKFLRSPYRTINLYIYFMHIQGIKMEISTLPILCLYYDKKQVVQSSNHPYH